MLLRLAYLGVTNAFAVLRLLPMSGRDKDVEFLALRHEITVLERQLGGNSPRFDASDRAFLAALLHPLPRDVLRYASCCALAGHPHENRPRPSRLDPCKTYLERRFAAGCTNVTRLHRELLAENTPVTYQMVRAYIATLRAAPPQAPPP
ncbi:hypothetical protein [Streptomyces sp. NBC_01320]|uniref:hypothetical protein n=1 Tax=Streptomyces sp. NBC_01320 TaxID=2903824 RepID=UPI002E11754B|nr:hypothetical protein OG395_51955 [Streptomyces sp. NBC_01320]